MALAAEDLEELKRYMTQWLAEQGLSRDTVVHDIELRERMVRVEEELKHQRELMQQGFEQIDRRFEAMQQQMDKRFEQVDKRFEQMDKRFEDLTRRLDRFMFWSFGATLTVGGVVITVLKFF